MIAFIFTSLLCLPNWAAIDTEGLPKQLRQQFAVVPSGEVLLDAKRFHVETFYMAKFEVSNAEYTEFLRDLAEDGDSEAISRAAVQSSGWDIPGTSLKPFAANYHRHASFADYPVVNVSHEGARMYCDWLEAKLNADAGTRRYEVTLPTRTQWLRAARPQNPDATYAWGASYLRNSEGKFLCNFNPVSPEQIQYDAASDSHVVVEDHVLAQRRRGTFTTAPCKSYYANVLGIHNLNGNVAEMVAEDHLAVGGSWNSTGYDVRNESTLTFDEPSPYVGFRPIVRVVE